MSSPTPLAATAWPKRWTNFLMGGDHKKRDFVYFLISSARGNEEWISTIAKNVIGTLPHIALQNGENAALGIIETLMANIRHERTRDKAVADIAYTFSKVTGAERSRLQLTLFSITGILREDIFKSIPVIVGRSPDAAYDMLKLIFDRNTADGPILATNFAKTARVTSPCYMHAYMSWFIPVRCGNTTAIMHTQQWCDPNKDLPRDMEAWRLLKRIKGDWNNINPTGRAHYMDVKRHYSNIEAVLLGRKTPEEGARAIQKKTGADYRALVI